MLLAFVEVGPSWEATTWGLGPENKVDPGKPVQAYDPRSLLLTTGLHITMIKLWWLLKTSVSAPK